MIVLMLAVFFAVLSIAISFSVDNPDSAYNTEYSGSSGNGSGSSAGKVGLVVEEPVGGNTDNSQGGVSN